VAKTNNMALSAHGLKSNGAAQHSRHKPAAQRSAVGIGSKARHISRRD